MSFEKVIEVDITLGRENLAGRVFGDQVFRDAIEPALESRREQDILLLSLKGAQFATGSFFKATWLRLHPEDAAAVPSVLADMSDDVRFEFDTFLRGHRRPGVEALKWSPSAIVLGRLHGQVEVPTRSALIALLSKPGSTPPALHQASQKDVTATAWTNRLNELHWQGLALRQRAGRAWRFFPIMQEIDHG